MSFIRKFGKTYYVCKSKKCNFGRLPHGKQIQSEFMIKPTYNGTGQLPIGGFITFPKEFIGKKIRIKVEISDELDLKGSEDLFNKVMPKDFLDTIPFAKAKERENRNKIKREYRRRTKDEKNE